MTSSMIVRDEEHSFLLITQPDHAQLAEIIAAAMRTETALAGPHREAILLATREHDNGWIEVDAEATIEPATGRPCDFISGPAPIKHELWTRGVTRVGKVDARAGALVAQHALTVYAYRQNEPEWLPFFHTLTAMRDALLERIGCMAGAARDEFDDAYRCVRLGDVFSLQFCNGWTQPADTLGYRATLDGSALRIAPDPFEGATVPLKVIGRRIPARVYGDDADLRAAIASSTPCVVDGSATGQM
jgi:hypothetical protein